MTSRPLLGPFAHSRRTALGFRRILRIASSSAWSWPPTRSTRVILTWYVEREASRLLASVSNAFSVSSLVGLRGCRLATRGEDPSSPSRGRDDGARRFASAVLSTIGSLARDGASSARFQRGVAPEASIGPAAALESAVVASPSGWPSVTRILASLVFGSRPREARRSVTGGSRAGGS